MRRAACSTPRSTAIASRAPCSPHTHRRSAGSRARAALVALAALLLPGLAVAQDWPARPVRMIVPFSAGGSVDVIARLLGASLSSALGQQLVIETRPGAGTLIGTEAAAKAASDGYTLLMINASSASAISLYKTVPYDLVKDFVPVGLVAYTPFVLVVHPSVPATTLDALLTLSRAQPGSLPYASAGNGVGSHLAVEAFKALTRVDWVHVPYKGVAPAVTALVAGESKLMIVNLVSALPHVSSGAVRALGLADAHRAPLLPAVPTMAEAGLPGYAFTEWYGVMAPAGTPGAIVARLNAEIARAVEAPAFRERLAALGAEPLVRSPDAFADYLGQEIATYARLIRSANIQPD